MARLRIEKARGVARVTLTRPEKHNAFDDLLIADLTDAIMELGGEGDTRVIRLESEGPSFSAGADLEWMRKAGAASEAENLADARRLARLMHVLDTCPKPTIAVVQGAAFGGGVGLVACCDIAVASQSARFALSEVKLGLIPSAIGPYVVRAIGARNARRYFQTAEVFDARTAARLGLVHEFAEPEALSRRADEITEALLKTAPEACREAKRLLADIACRPIDADLIEMTARRIAAIRSREEAREGLDAFHSRRRPTWLLEDTIDDGA